MNKYADNFCESVKIITESLLEGLKFDQTVECTIVDDSKADVGVYRVSNGSTTFTAYSQEKYTKGTAVFVTIPNGDYNKDKIITGKKATTLADNVLVYYTPFDNLLDVTGNLIDINTNKGLIANHPKVEEEIFDTQVLNNGQDLNGGRGYADFTRLGVRANFKTLLKDLNCQSGNYGLHLEITFKNYSSEGEEILTTRDCYLQVEDMIGNPYNFETYFSQEKVFDITSLGLVTRIKATLFQDKDFKDNMGDDIPHSYKFMDEEVILLPNILIDNIYIALGYDLSAQGDNFASLYTFNSMSYNPSLTEEDNEKTIHLRWLRDGQIMKPDMTDELEIRWYRFKLGKPSPDDLAGVNWERIETETDKEYSLIFNPDIAKEQELVKVIALYGAKPGYYQISIIEEEFNAKPTDYYTRNGDEYVRCKEGDKYDSAIDYYYKQDETRQTYFTQPITFNNEVAVPNQATMDGLRGLTLIHKNESDGLLTSSQGNFLLYNQANSLQDKSQGNIIRIIGCVLELNGIPQKFDVNTSVSWKFPIKNTMIKPIGEYANLYKQVVIGKKDFNNLTNYYRLVDGEYILADTYVENEIYYTIDNYAIQTWQGNNDDLTNYGFPIFKYTINQQFSYSNLNNIIECRVVYNGIEYVGSTNLTFGRIGSSGTDATFVLDLDDVNAITVGKDEQVSVSARLYDSNNESVDISSGYTITWNWFKKPFIYEDDKEASLILEHSNGPNCKISHTITEPILLNINEVYILEATIIGWGNYPLTAYLPIPLRAADNYISITGADSIVYLSDGTPQYYKEAYEMHKDDNKDEGEWGIIYQIAEGEEEEESIKGGYWPTLKNNCLAPSLIYSDGIETVSAVQYKEDGEAKWTQPILIIQNRYPSEMINQWDGKTIELNEDEGTILASAIGAGRKNKDNTFSGVILGDWADKADASIGSKTGLYGYRNGALSFGFKDDGTAFIGTKSKGQLQFDGNESTISSASYRTAGGSGMILDFDEPYIKMRKYPGQKVINDTGINTEVYEEVGFVQTEEKWNEYFGDNDGIGYYLSSNNMGETEYIETDWKNRPEDSATVYYKKYNKTIGGSFPTDQIAKIPDRETFNIWIKDGYTLYKKGVYTDGKVYYYSIDYWYDALAEDDEIYYYDNDNDDKSKNFSIELNASSEDIIYPLKIGDYFRVKWDGTIEADEGIFKGTLQAANGTFSGKITGSKISGGTITGSTIDGGTIYASDLIVEEEGTLKGIFTVKNTLFTHAGKEIKANKYVCGSLGFETANPTNVDELETEDIVAVGLKSENENNTIKVSNYNVGLSYIPEDSSTASAYITLQSDGIIIGATQKGIRFNGNIDQTGGSTAKFKATTLSTLEAGATTLTSTLDVSGTTNINSKLYVTDGTDTTTISGPSVTTNTLYASNIGGPNNGKVMFYRTVDFSEATVIGLEVYATLA